MILAGETLNGANALLEIWKKLPNASRSEKLSYTANTKKVFSIQQCIIFIFLTTRIVFQWAKL